MFSYDGRINKDSRLLMPWMGGAFSYLYTTPEDELLACRSTAWLGSFLNCSPVYDISGPDVVKLLNYVTVNRDYAKLKIGGSRHAILCNDKGQMLADGVLMRKDEQTYRTYWLAPVLAYYVDSLGMDVHGEWVLNEFFFQIDGPKSLEIMEKASQCDLHDLKFAQNKHITIAGIETSIHRLGMSGCLAYEMHGDINDAETVFSAIVEAGEEFGIRKLGFEQYCHNHTQGGYPNQWIHFWYPWHSGNKAMSDYIKACPYSYDGFNIYPYLGSASYDPENSFVTPFDVDWDYLISYDHDFIGKEALLAISKNPPRKVVTLEWNADDVAQVFASQFRGNGVEPTDNIIGDGDCSLDGFVISKVLAEGKMIGVASGRLHDYYHRRMISLGFISREYALEGKELTVVWGTKPEAQMEIRATVAQFPYYNEEYRNETFDVEKIPHPVFSK